MKKYIGMASSGGFTGYAGFLEAVENNNLQYLSDLVKFVNNGTSAQAKNMLNYYGLDFADLMVSASELLQVEYEPGLPVTQKVLDQYEQKLQAIVDRTEGKRTLEDFAECGLTAANLADAVDQLSSEEKEQLELILDKLGLINHKPVAEVEPADGATGVELDAEVKATFDRDVVEGDLSGVKIEAGGVEMDVLAALEGRVLTVAHPDFAYLTEYTVTIPEDAVQCEHGTGNDEIVWSFTTKEDDTPVGPYILTVQTDKAIYEPDEAVEVSGLLLENNEAQNPVPDVAVGLVLYLGDDEIIFEQTYTDATGAFAWTIPANTLELGDYRVYATVNEASAEASFKVSTEATGKPEIKIYKPAPGDNYVQLNAEVSATFNMDVTAVDLEGVRIEKDGVTLNGVSVSLEGRVLKLSHPRFSYRTTYEVIIPAGAVGGETGL